MSSPLGMETLRAAKTLGGRKYVFPTSRATGHLLYNGMTQAARRLVRRLKMDRWTPHDLRRTASTHMTAIGIDRHVVDRVLGHKDTTVLDS
jgi:integrase